MGAEPTVYLIGAPRGTRLGAPLAKTLRSKGHRALLDVLVASRGELSQRALASRLKVPRSYVSKIETGERGINPVEFVEWAKASGVDPVELFRRFVRRLTP